MNAIPERPTRLLLVDDDPSMVRLVTNVINRSFPDEIQLKSLTDPVQARDCIESDLWDILITDLEMPNLNGLGLLRCAKRKNALTQVFFMTGHSAVESITDALELGATDYLLKPLDTSELIELLSEARKRIRRWRQACAETISSRVEREPVPQS
jgi:DNA-binding NtrC family response regulator